MMTPCSNGTRLTRFVIFHLLIKILKISNIIFSEINERPQSGTKIFICLFLEIGNDARTTEFVGCMSFGARKISQEKSIFKVGIASVGLDNNALLGLVLLVVRDAWTTKAFSCFKDSF